MGGLRHREGGARVAHARDAVAGPAGRQREHVTDVLVVVHDQHLGHVATPGPLLCLRGRAPVAPACLTVRLGTREGRPGRTRRSGTNADEVTHPG